MTSRKSIMFKTDVNLYCARPIDAGIAYAGMHTV